MTAVKSTGRCKCGRPVFNGHVDADGKPCHPCCDREGIECGACAASDAADRKWTTSGIKWARRVKEFWRAEADRANEERNPGHDDQSTTK